MACRALPKPEDFFQSNMGRTIEKGTGFNYPQHSQENVENMVAECVKNLSNP